MCIQDVIKNDTELNAAFKTDPYLISPDFPDTLNSRIQRRIQRSPRDLSQPSLLASSLKEHGRAVHSPSIEPCVITDATGGIPSFGKTERAPVDASDVAGTRGTRSVSRSRRTVTHTKSTSLSI